MSAPRREGTHVPLIVEDLVFVREKYFPLFLHVYRDAYTCCSVDDRLENNEYLKKTSLMQHQRRNAGLRHNSAYCQKHVTLHLLLQCGPTKMTERIVYHLDNIHRRVTTQQIQNCMLKAKIAGGAISVTSINNFPTFRLTVPVTNEKKLVKKKTSTTQWRISHGIPVNIANSIWMSG